MKEIAALSVIWILDELHILIQVHISVHKSFLQNLEQAEPKPPSTLLLALADLLADLDSQVLAVLVGLLPALLVGHLGGWRSQCKNRRIKPQVSTRIE